MEELLIGYNFSTVSIYQLLPFLSFVTTLSLGTTVLIQNKKEALNRLFFLFNISLAFWFFGTFMMFSSVSDEQVIFWDRFVYIGVVFTPTFMYHLALIFVRRSPPKGLLTGLYGASLAFLFLTRTNVFVDGVFHYAWGAHAKAQIGHHVFIVFFFILVISSILILRTDYVKKKAKDFSEREYHRARSVLFAFILLVSLGSLAFLPAYNVGLYPLSLLSGVIYSSMLTYAITKHNLFDMRIVSAQVFTFAMWLLSFSNIFFSGAGKERLKASITFFAVSCFGMLLLRSFSLEMKQKEKLSEVNRELKVLNDTLEEKVRQQTEEIVKAYEVEKKARTDLEYLNKVKGDFITIVAHQLRTPLSGMNWAFSLLFEKGLERLDQDERGLLHQAAGANRKLIRIVNDLLDVSNIETGYKTVKTSENDIVDAIRCAIVQARVENKKPIPIRVVSTKGLPNIPFDHKKIVLALRHVIGNALDYTKEGGLISVSTDIDVAGGFAVVNVSDTGIGMSNDEQEKLFSKFYRSADAFKMETDRSGLGLFIVKNIMEQHAGEVRIRSVKGEGTTVSLTFPLKEETS